MSLLSRLQRNTARHHPRPVPLSRKTVSPKTLKKILYRYRTRKKPKGLSASDLRIMRITARRHNLKPGQEWSLEALDFLHQRLPHLKTF